VQQKVQVVDRHHLGRTTRGHEQRMQRVGDIERGAGQRLCRRPADAVPRKVEQPDRDLPIDLMRSCQLGIVCSQAIPG